MNFDYNWMGVVNLKKVYSLYRKGTKGILDFVKESSPYWEALKNDDLAAWNELPERSSFWQITNDNNLVEDTKWTAASKAAALKCLDLWTPDSELRMGQQIWGNINEKIKRPKYGGGSVLHSMAHLTFDPKVSYMLKGWLDKKAVSVNQSTWEKVSPIHVFAAHGYPSGVEVLMQCGADISAKTKIGATPVEYAAQYGDISTLKRILYWGGLNIDEEDKIRVFKACISGKDNKKKEELFLRERIFNTLEQWQDLKIKINGSIMKKDISWAQSIWGKENRPFAKNNLSNNQLFY